MEKHMTGWSPEESIQWSIRVLQNRAKSMENVSRPLTENERAHVAAIEAALQLFSAGLELLREEDRTTA